MVNGELSISHLVNKSLWERLWPIVETLCSDSYRSCGSKPQSPQRVSQRRRKGGEWWMEQLLLYGNGHELLTMNHSLFVQLWAFVSLWLCVAILS